MSNSVHFVLGQKSISFDQEGLSDFQKSFDDEALCLKIYSGVYELFIEIGPNRSVKFIPDYVSLLPASDGFILEQYQIHIFKLPFNDEANPYKVKIIEAGTLFCIFAFY